MKQTLFRWGDVMSDINIKLTARNAHLLRAILEKHESIAEFCRAYGLCYSRVSALLTFRDAPFRANGDLTTLAENICSATGRYPSELWPRDVARMKLKKSSAEIEISTAEAMAICGSAESGVIQREFLARWLSKLNPREIEAIGVIQSGGTYEDCAKTLDVSRERARQIQIKALRKLRIAAARDGVNSAIEAGL